MVFSTRLKQKLTCQPDVKSGAGRPRFIIALFVLLLIAAAMPVVIVKVPPLCDYLNHLARVHVIASLAEDPILAQFYVVDWDFVSNLGMDLVVPFLMRFTDIYLSGRIFVIMVMVLILTGVYAIHYALYKQLSLGPLVAFLFIYNEVLLWGFLNYLLGLGIALWAIAAWIRFRNHQLILRVGMSLIFSLVLFVCHLYAVGLYGLAIICFEVWMLSKKGIRDRRRMMTDALALAVPFIVVLILFMAGPTSKLAFKNIWKPFGLKYKAISWVIELYNPVIDRVIGMVIFGTSLWALGRRILRLHPAGWLLLIVGVLIYAVMPNWLLRAWAADYRLPIAILFILIGFAWWDLSPSSSRALFVGAIFAIAILRFILVGTTWMQFDPIYAELRNAFTHVEPGSTILRTDARWPRRFKFRKASPLDHTVCLASIDRSAFTPQIFTIEGVNVLAINSEYSELSNEIRNWPTLSEIIGAEESHGEELGPGEYWARWRKRFDYLLVMHTNSNDHNPLPERLTLVYQGEVFQLYRVKPP